MEMSSSLSDAAKAYLQRWSAGVNEQDARAMESLYHTDFREKPVSVETFMFDRDYLGRVLEGNVFEKIIDDLIELFDGDYTEVVLKGAIGWGKTTMAYIGIAYDLYLVSCLKSPGETFGLIPGSNVAFLNIAALKTQAIRVMFGGLKNLIYNSPYFRQAFPYNPRLTSELRFPRGVLCYPVAASEQALLGEGVFSAAFDEMNFYKIVEKSKRSVEGGTYDQAVALYNRLSRRIRSRMNQRGWLPGHMWLVSSARYPNDFTERKAREAKTDRRIFVRDYTAWETKPKSYYMQETFKVEVGDITRRSRVLAGGEADVNWDRVMNVPEDFRDEFEKDPDGATQDYGGKPVLSVHPFFGRRDLLLQMFELGVKAGLRNPWSRLEATLEDPEVDYLIPANLHWLMMKDVTGQEKKRFYQDSLYFCHIDLAKTTDACGFAVGHAVGEIPVKRGIGPESRTELKPEIRMDLILRIIAPKGGEIIASKVRGIIYELQRVGIEFGKITYDSWGSMESIQTLVSEGFPAEEFSLDKDSVGYDTLKNAVYDQRVLCYPNPKLLQELSNLEKNELKRKVDHPPNGSKDMADCLAGVVHHIEENFQTGRGVRVPVKPGIIEGAEGGTEQEDLWAKAQAGIPLSEDELKKL